MRSTPSTQATPAAMTSILTAGSFSAVLLDDERIMITFLNQYMRTGAPTGRVLYIASRSSLLSLMQPWLTFLPLPTP